MAAEFVIAGRLALPSRDKHWELEIENEEGGIDVYEASVRYDEDGCKQIEAQVTEIVGWAPRSIVFVRKAWELAQVVAEELATALEGAVYCDVDNEVFFDTAGKARPATTIPALEERLRQAFNNPQRFFDRWQREEQARFNRELGRDPSLVADNDWSDVD
jgi:hypothetical protein